jgi:hypothetical protein
MTLLARMDQRCAAFVERGSESNIRILSDAYQALSENEPRT